jgi:hypothetical protein
MNGPDPYIILRQGLLYLYEWCKCPPRRKSEVLEVGVQGPPRRLTADCKRSGDAGCAGHYQNCDTGSSGMIDKNGFAWHNGWYATEAPRAETDCDGPCPIE